MEAGMYTDPSTKFPGRQTWRRRAMRLAPMAAIAVLTFCAVSCGKRGREGGAAPTPRAGFSWPAMGTVAEFEAAGDPAMAARMRNVVADAFTEVEEELSLFLTNSVVSRLNHGETVEVPENGHAATVIGFALETASVDSSVFNSFRH